MNNSKKSFSDNWGRKNIEYLRKNGPFEDNSSNNTQVFRLVEKCNYSKSFKRRPTIRK